MNIKSLRKMYVTLCFFILLAILISFIAQNLIIRSTLLMYTEQALEVAHQQSHDNIYNYLANVENVVLSLSYNALVQRFLNETEAINRLRYFPDLQTVFSALFMSQPDIIGFAIYDYSGNFITANAVNFQAIVQTQYLYQKYDFITYDRFSNDLYYVMTVPIFDFSTPAINVPRIGTIVFTMNKAYIRSQIDMGNQLYGASMALFDSSGHILVGEYNGSTIASVFPNTGWKLVTHLEAGVITEHLQPLMLITMGISLAVVVFVTIFVFYFLKENYEAALVRNQLEILAYRSQINPHFLSNTFECISGIAMSREAPEIVEMSAALSQMFSYAVKEADFVTVAEELAHIEYYALIIGYRFMGRIKINIEVEENAEQCRIPRLILQPVVENAVFHGLEPKIGEGNINMAVVVNGGYLYIRISDNGVGAERIEASKSDGIGLANIIRRLNIFYGDKAEIKINTALQEGCTVVIKLPAEKVDDV